MLKKNISILKNSGISPYIWTILSILPFYFIFESTSTIAIVVGILLTILFLIFFRIAYVSQGWLVYVWILILIGISITVTILYSYVYFAFFLAYYVGNIKNRTTFFVLYSILLLGTTLSINYNFIQQDALFLKQIPFVVIVWISVIQLPFTVRSRKVMGQLEENLEDANKKISELIKLEERERIARDLHDTLGQRLSLIGLKSDLARRLIQKNPEQARNELKDVQQTARTALNEVRKMVSSMRGIRLKDELVLVKQLLDAAEITYNDIDHLKLPSANLLTENILSMCLKESITNIVKHSGATSCHISIQQSWEEIIMTIKDNGHFNGTEVLFEKGNGLKGMKERLEFVNGSLELVIDGGTSLIIKVPNDVKQIVKEERA